MAAYLLNQSTGWNYVKHWRLLIISPAYEVYRGYIVFAFSVYKYVCVCACVFVNFFLSKISRKLLDLGF